MKKILCLILALALCLGALSACQGQTPQPTDAPTQATQPHIHSFGPWEVLARPTVDMPGAAQSQCECGQVQTLTLPVLTDSGYTLTDNTATTQAPGTGTYTIELEGVSISFSAPTPVKEPEYEDVMTSPDFMAALALAGGEKAKSGEDITLGKFTFAAGVYFESSNTSYFDNGNVNTQKKDITFILQGSVNSIQFDVRGASSSGCVMTILRLVAGGEPVQVYQSKELASGDLLEGVSVKDLEPGTYVIQTSGSARIGDFYLIERMEKSEPVAIEAKTTVDKFLAGRNLNAGTLSVELVYGNGRRDTVPASAYTTDLANVDANTPGKHTVTVTHTPTGFTASYDILIYTVESIRLSDHSLDTSRVTHPVQKLYLAGGSYDNYKNLAVIATCSAPGVEGKEEFVLREGEYTCTPATLDDPQVAVTTPSGAYACYEVTILHLTDRASNTQVVVDQNAIPGQGIDGVVTVKSINDALMLLQLLEAPADQRKTITLCPGTYREKVDVSMPNLSVVAAQGAKAEDIVVIYDALNGIMDPSGTSAYSTDGSATFSLRQQAVNFYARGFTIMNYYNTHELYEQSKQIAGAGTQAVALLVRSDKALFENMRLSSYQDTLYAENGRHIYRDCYIEGRTDYIFGNNATAYFVGCQIQSIGAGLEEKNGGYVVTTKGGKDGAQVKYGFIFNGCSFTGDENVQPGSVSVARGWDKYMTMMVMNSSLDDSFSLEAYGDTASPLNDRYTKMNADPVAAQLFEYGNTGDGALTQDLIATAENGVIPGICSVPDEAAAKEYADFSLIFAATNGGITYADAWDGTVE